MSSKIPPLKFNMAAAFNPMHGLQTHDFEMLVPALELARKEMLVHDANAYSSCEIPSEKLPLDHGFFEMPDRLLAEYKREGEKSELADLSNGRPTEGASGSRGCTGHWWFLHGSEGSHGCLLPAVLQ